MDENTEVAMCAQFLEIFPQVPPTPVKVKALAFDDMPSPNEERAPEVELKHLPSSLRYEFIGPNSIYPVTVNVSLNVSQVDSLLRVFRMHRKATRYTLDDLKDVHPSMCMHCILIEDNHKSLIEH